MIDTSEQKKVQYRLRRIGRPATKSSVKNIMNLNGDVTRFGRHSGNDYYLDSSKLECFISRWHAEIHRVLQNGKYHFVLRDNSLNGTYVNNCRVLGNHRLKNGEIICFGHTNGKNLKPGDYAPQTDSEFEFVFEEYMPEEVEDNRCSIHEQQNRINHPAVDSTTDIHSSSNHLVSAAQCKAVGSDSVPATCIYNITGSKSESLRSPSTVTSHSSAASSPVLQDVSNKSTSPNTTGLVPLEQYAVQSGNGGHPSAPCNITVHVKQDIKSPLHNQQQAATATSVSVIQDIKVSREDKSTLDPANSSPVHKSVTQSKSSQSIRSSGKKRKTSQTSSTGSSKKKNRASWPKDKKRRSSAAEHYDNDVDDDDDEDDEDGGESEDSSWHYDGEKCDAPHCKRPKTKRVSWVQCDDCDDWYHTQCAGCRYNKVKKANAEFHCGCLEKS